MGCTQYDLLGRVSEVAMFSGYPGSLPSGGCATHSTPTGITTTAYDANSSGKWITVTEKAEPTDKVRKQRSDVLGRLVEAVEDPSGLNYSTTYDYNALDNLTQVTQGSQTRTFNYSSLGRLISATNPESGTINYAYFDSGDLFRKTDARNIWSENSYDPLHRILTKTYSDSTPPVTYEYWTATAPNIGQLKSITSSVASTAYYYDWLGKVTSSEHAINGYFGNLVFDYDWYLNGSLQAITYPSNRQVSYSVDDAGRTNKISSGSLNYADMTVLGAGVPAYSPDGRLVQAKLGNNHWITMNYHSPGTATTYNLGTTQGAGDVTQLGYVFPVTGNNGNLESQTITRSNLSTVSQSFFYDNLNRLQSAGEGGSWSRTYGYDRYGNLYVATSSVIPAAQSPEPTLPGHFNTANNRLTMTGTGYDSAGNQTTYSPFTLEYDAESRNTVVKSSGTPYVTFSYDGEGRRIKKVTSSGTTYYVYDALGQLAAEYSTSNAMTYTETSYMFTDMLGSVRTITDQ